MKSVKHFLVKVSSIYQDSKTTESGFKYFVPIDYGDVELITIHGVVKSVPQEFNGIVEVGDTLIFDQNILRNSYSANGKDVYINQHHILDNVCWIPSDRDSSFGYIRNEEIFGLHDTVFVKPIPIEKQSETASGLIVSNEHYKGFVLNEGIAVCGKHKGKRVIYSDYSEHQFILNNTIYWRMTERDIIGCRD